MNIILLANNNCDHPILRSQLLDIYEQISIVKNIKIFCDNNKSHEVLTYPIENISKSKYHILKYLHYTLDVRRAIIFHSSDNTCFHIRGFVSGIVFFVASRLFIKRTDVKYIYDPRGAFLEEKTEVNSSVKYFSFFLKYIEKNIIKNSEKTIVTSKKFMRLFSSVYGYKEKYIVNYNSSSLNTLERNFSLGSLQVINIIYMGTLNYWHNLNEIVNILKRLRLVMPNKKLNLYFLTQNRHHNHVRKAISNLGYDNIVLDYISYREIPSIIKNMHIGISIVRPTKSSKIASPIKISDYIKSGLVLIANKGIGDFDDYFINSKSALLYDYGNPSFSYSDLIQVKPNLNKKIINKLSVSKNISNLTSIIKSI